MHKTVVILLFVSSIGCRSQSLGDGIARTWRYKADLPSVAALALPGTKKCLWLVSLDLLNMAAWNTSRAAIEIRREHYALGVQIDHSGSGEWSSNALRFSYGHKLDTDLDIGIKIRMASAKGSLSNWYRIESDLYSHFSLDKLKLTLYLGNLLGYESHDDWSDNYSHQFLQADYPIASQHEVSIRWNNNHQATHRIDFLYRLTLSAFALQTGLSTDGTLILSSSVFSKFLHCTLGLTWSTSASFSPQLAIGRVAH